MWVPLFLSINTIDKQYINMQLFNNGIREEVLTYKAFAIISKSLHFPILSYLRSPTSTVPHFTHLHIFNVWKLYKV